MTTEITSAVDATGFHCNALNVSCKPLLIPISIVVQDGSVLVPVPVRNSKTDPDVVASNGIEGVPRTRAYCKVQISGADDPNDVRVVMKANLIGTFDQGGRTNIPVFLSWVLEGR
jgi:hypothetical protein